MKKGLILMFIIFLVSIGGYMLIKEQDFYSDELPHTTQIYKFMLDDFTLVPYLTVIPGYHFVMAETGLLLGQPIKIQSIRLISLIILLITLIPIIYIFSGHSFLTTLQIYFFPSLHIFFFLVYTDLFSALFVVTSIYLLLNKEYKLSGVMAILGILIRQNNVFWLAFHFLYVIIEEIDFKVYKLVGFDYFISDTLNAIKKLWVQIIGLIGFGVFVFINKGIVLGVDAKSHPLSLHLGNIWYLLFSLTFLLLPVVLNRIPKMFEYIKYNKKILLFLFAVLLLFLGSSVSSHPYNNNPVFLKNKVLLFAYANIFNVFLYFIPVLLAIMFLLTTEFTAKGKYGLYAITFGYLIFSWMVEIRYYTIPFILFMLWREDEGKLIEIEQLIYSILLSIVMFGGILSWKIFW